MANCLASRCGGGPIASNCRMAPPVAALAGGAEREVVGAVAGGDPVDVGSHCHQRGDEARASCGGVRPDRRTKGEPGHVGVLVESVSEQLEERDGVIHHQIQGDGPVVVVSAPRASATSLVPVDDGEVLLQAEKLLEAAYLVDHGQAGTLLDQQEHRVVGVGATDTNPLGGVAELDGLELVDHNRSIHPLVGSTDAAGEGSMRVSQRWW